MTKEGEFIFKKVHMVGGAKKEDGMSSQTPKQGHIIEECR
jgi:hypothetical protein